MLILFILCKISWFSYSVCLAWISIFVPLWGEFWGLFPQNEFRYCHNPQKDRPWVITRRMSKSIRGFDLGTCLRKIQYNQVTNKEKVTKSHFTYLGRSPRRMDWNENLHWCRSRWRNNGRQVQNWKTSGILMSSRVKIWLFPSTLHVGLTTVHCLW